MKRSSKKAQPKLIFTIHEVAHALTSTYPERFQDGGFDNPFNYTISMRREGLFKIEQTS